MRVSSVNNNNYNNKPSFGIIIGAEKLPIHVLKAVSKNPEFNKLAKELEKEGKDLYLSHTYHPYSQSLNLKAGREYYFDDVTVFIDNIWSNLENNIKKFVASDYYKEVKKEITKLERENIDRETAISKLYVKKTTADNSVIPETPALQPKKKNFIQRLLGL